MARRPLTHNQKDAIACQIALDELRDHRHSVTDSRTRHALDRAMSALEAEMLDKRARALDEQGE